MPEVNVSAATCRLVMALVFAAPSAQILALENFENPFLPTGAADHGWPFVRGASFNAHSLEVQLAEKWPASGPPILWVRELGQGYSALVAYRDRVYTQAQSLGGQYVYCLNADTGTTVWSYRYAAPYQLAGIYPGPRATPTYANKHVYFAAPNGLVGCLTADTGKLVWSRNVCEEYYGSGGVNFGYACSPTVVDDMVILPVGGKGASLLALDARDGSKVWAVGDDASSYSPAFPIELDGQRLVVGYLQNVVVLHSLSTGEIVGRHDLSNGYDEHSAWPLYAEPYLWLSGPFRGGSQLLQLSANPENVPMKSIWQSKSMSNDVVSSVLVDGHVFGFDLFEAQAKTHRPSRGKFRCLELSTGNVRWSQGTGRLHRNLDNHAAVEQEIGQAGIVSADGKLLLLNELGELILLSANPERYDELARASVLKGEITWTPPSLHRGRIYVRNHSRVVCVYVGKSELLDAKSPTLSVADLPQTEYRDWASTILAIEPEYAFDIPSKDWLWKWYFASASILVLAELAGWSFRNLGSTQIGYQLTSRTVAFLLGALGTTFLSLWTGTFIFTWPICLFVAMEIVTDHSGRSSASRSSVGTAIAGRIPLVIFAATCLAYFLLCRRLSLVFEWIFLGGFLAALPVLLLQQRHTYIFFCNSLLRITAFSCFYVASVAFLHMKYL